MSLVRFNGNLRFNSILGEIAQYQLNGHDPHIDQYLSAEVVRGFKAKRLLANPTTHIGIEVEVENVPNPQVVTLWQYKTDGSLRNHGIEYVSYPLRGAAIELALENLHLALHRERGMKGHEFTDRTSVHIHMNVRDLNQEQIANIILLYLACEPLLYDFAGGERHKNIFCVPLNQAPFAERLAKFFSAVEEKRPHPLWELTKAWSKYTGFNLLPVFDNRLGTIEFRHLAGTMDVDRIMTWINLILSLRNYAVATTFVNLRSTVLELNSNSHYTAFLYQVFGHHAASLDLGKSWGLMEKSIIFIKDCLVSLNQWVKSLHTIDPTESALVQRFLSFGTILLADEKNKEEEWLEEDVRPEEEEDDEEGLPPPPVFDPIEAIAAEQRRGMLDQIRRDFNIDQRQARVAVGEGVVDAAHLAVRRNF